MSNKDIDFSKISLSADEFDAVMRRALDAPVPPQDCEKACEPADDEAKVTKAKRRK